jgi:predicted Zn-dependent protease
LGSLLRGEGNAEDAGPYVGHALRLRPTSPEARFQVAAVHAATGKLQQARDEFQSLEQEYPDFLEVHLQLATLYARMNLKAESEREQAIVLKLNEKEREANPQRPQ